MSYLCLSVRFLQPYYHGRCDGAEPEWPPSPLRMFQALVNAAARRWPDARFRNEGTPALQWLEALSPHTIVAAAATLATSPCRLHVPDNVADKVAKSWCGGRGANLRDYVTEKDVRPMRLNGEGLHYLYSVNSIDCPHLQTLACAARSMTHLGWGIDMAVANATVISEQEAAALPGERWHPVGGVNATSLRTPMEGTFNALIAKHEAFLNRIGRDARGNECFIPVPPLSKFRRVGFRRANDPVPRPAALFELRNDDDALFLYPQEKLIHIAGMVRHLAIEAMKSSPPDGVPGDWVERYVAGHRRVVGQETTKKDKGDGISGSDAQHERLRVTGEHQQFSYVPLPSIGHARSDHGVRRVMIVAPPGGDRLLMHLAQRLDGRCLRPTPQTRMDHPPTLKLGSQQNDEIARCYTQPANVWASVTPVILPGHDDHKPGKTHKLIARALAQSGIEQPCSFEWSVFSRFPKSISAHKYDRHKCPIGYIRPDHLLHLSAVHVTLRFSDDARVRGPLVVGAGRHCGLGVLAACDSVPH